MNDAESGVFRSWHIVSRRRFRRWFVDVPGTLHVPRGEVSCVIRDMTPMSAGLRITGIGSLPIGTEVALDLCGFGRVAAEVRSSDSHRAGLVFLHAERQAMELARYLLNNPPDRRIERRKTNADASLIWEAQTYPCVIMDVSRVGACVRTDRTTPIGNGDEVVLKQQELGDITASVRWIADQRIGLMVLQVATSQLSIIGDRGETKPVGSARPVASGVELLEQLKRAARAHIQEQVRRQDRKDPYSDVQKLVDAHISEERAKLEQLARKFDQDGDSDSARHVWNLINGWLPNLGRELMTQRLALDA